MLSQTSHICTALLCRFISLYNKPSNDNYSRSVNVLQPSISTVALYLFLLWRWFWYDIVNLDHEYFESLEKLIKILLLNIAIQMFLQVCVVSSIQKSISVSIKLKLIFAFPGRTLQTSHFQKCLKNQNNSKTEASISIHLNKPLTTSLC